MERTHDGMTIEQRRALQFWLDVHEGQRQRYLELNGELPMPDDRWEDELEPRQDGDEIDGMPSVDGLFDPPEV